MILFEIHYLYPVAVLLHTYTWCGSGVCPSPKNVTPKMTQKDMKIHFESFLGVNFFWGRGQTPLPHPVLMLCTLDTTYF